MKKLLLLLSLIVCTSRLFAADEDADSVKQRVTLLHTDRVDSLKKELPMMLFDSLKAPIYTQIAQQYMRFDTINNKKTRVAYQYAALSNTMLALHYYSRYNDTIGLRNSFNDLAKVYHAQHKYAQAKWIILQSNSLSRIKNDNPNVIASLLELASIKADIKDYKLAMKDLNEALTISSKNHYPQLESKVQLGYAMFYDKMKNYAKADIALKRSQTIDDSIKRDEEEKLMAKFNARDSIQQAKKKFYSVNSRRLSKNNSSKKIVIL